MSSRETARMTIISVPAPLGDPSALLRALPHEVALRWHPPEGASITAVGAAREHPVLGHDLGPLDVAAQDLSTTSNHHVFPRLEAPPPRLFGGLPFAPGLDNGPLWSSFGDGRFVLPRWCHGVRDGQAFLHFAASPEAADHDRALKEFDRVWEALETRTPSTQTAVAPSAEAPRLEQLDPAVWNRRIKEICALIATGRVEKIVTARTATVTSETPFETSHIMQRLARRYPRCTRFSFQWSGPTFVGATPETLFAKQGASLRTHALAGSVRVHPDLTADEAGTALLRSRKNREEHAVVLRQIHEALQPLAATIDHADAPRVMQLQSLLHLETPIRAQLQPDCRPTALLNALHPTPAVAGLPRTEAMRWIAANEEPRGWFTGPVGWIDAVGDSEFAVAIRCALLEGHAAHAFAGAGIMHDSDPPMEYSETSIKLRAMLEALGVQAERR